MNFGAMKKFKEHEQAKLVEITSTVTHGGAWYPSLFPGGKNEYYENHQYQANVEVTVHGNEGNQQSRTKVLGVFPGNQKAAQRAADQEAESLADVVHQKGVPVILNTPSAREQRQRERDEAAFAAQSAAWSAAETAQAIGQAKEDAKSALLFLAIFASACIILAGLAYLLAGV